MFMEYYREQKKVWQEEKKYFFNDRNKNYLRELAFSFKSEDQVKNEIVDYVNGEKMKLGWSIFHKGDTEKVNKIVEMFIEYYITFK